MTTAPHQSPVVSHPHQDLALCFVPRPFEVIAALLYLTDETLITVPQGVPLISDGLTPGSVPCWLLKCSTFAPLAALSAVSLVFTEHEQVLRMFHIQRP